MFIDDSFIAGPQGPDGLPTGHFTSSLSDERKLTVVVHPAYSVAQLGRREKDNRAPLCSPAPPPTHPNASSTAIPDCFRRTPLW